MRELIERFFSAWSEADKEKQAEEIAAALSAEVRYVDPRTAEPLVGPAAVADYVSGFTAMAPGAHAEVLHLDDRDGLTRATVAFVMADGMRQMGQYIVQADASGRPAHLVGFVGTGAD